MPEGALKKWELLFDQRTPLIHQVGMLFFNAHVIAAKLLYLACIIAEDWRAAAKWRSKLFPFQRCVSPHLPAVSGVSMK